MCHSAGPDGLAYENPDHLAHHRYTYHHTHTRPYFCDRCPHPGPHSTHTGPHTRPHRPDSNAIPSPHAGTGKEGIVPYICSSVLCLYMLCRREWPCTIPMTWKLVTCAAGAYRVPDPCAKRSAYQTAHTYPKRDAHQAAHHRADYPPHRSVFITAHIEKTGRHFKLK